MERHPIENLMGTSMENIKDMGVAIPAFLLPIKIKKLFSVCINKAYLILKML